jgi:dTDP-4-dehydrorhamnose 3,5-epimerase
MIQKFDFQKLDLKGAYIINPFFTIDERGSFIKSFEKNIYEEMGIKAEINETFMSVSSKNVVRGLHFQLNKPQAKLVCVVSGKVWDVIVDLRLHSKTYKKWVGVELSGENHKILYVPRGFAHGFLSLEDDSVMLYQCDGAYDKETDGGIVYNDPDIGIKWPFDLIDGEKNLIISEKDKNLMSLKEYIELIKSSME